MLDDGDRHTVTALATALLRPSRCALATILLSARFQAEASVMQQLEAD
jgi:hypothetical protein